MFKKVVLFTFCLLFISVTNIFSYASEPGDLRAVRSDYDIFVNGSRINFRAYDINNETHLNLFDIAQVFSETNKQFAARWSDRNGTLNITTGVSHSAIGFITPRNGVNAGSAKPSDTKLLLNKKEIDITGFTVSGSVYFNLRETARIMDFNIEKYPTEKIIKIDTYEPFSENIIKRIIDPTKPMIALTFDDGPSHVTVTILDELEKHNAVATFYVVGNRITRNETHRAIVLRAFTAGNEIANHSHSHRFLTRISDEAIRSEMINVNKAIESIIGIPPTHMRPPYADMDRRVRNVIAEQGLPIVLWSLDPSDWQTRNAEKTFDRVMENVKDKDIILLHDMWEPTGEAAVRLIPALIEKGFQLVTVSELMHHSGITMQPGTVYNSGVR